MFVFLPNTHHIAMAAVRVSSHPSFLVLSLCLYYYFLMSAAIHFHRACSLSFNLSFSSPAADLNQLINITGDASLASNALDLTPKRRDQTGRATYAQPVPLWDAATGEMASFNTTFDFRITVPPNSLHEITSGMAFFLGHVGFIPSKDDSGPGGTLGLLPFWTNGTGDGTIVAVEFDTYKDPQITDISHNHVGIDVNSLNSTASTDTSSPTRNLTSGDKMVATVRYVNVTKFLAVELNINGTSYYVNATVDLRRYLPEYVAVGFSAATGNAGEQYQILSWSFASTLEPKQQKHPHRVVLLTYVLASLLFLLACAALLAFLVWQKRKRRRRRSGGIPIASSDSDYEQQDDDSDYEQQVATASCLFTSWWQKAASTGISTAATERAF